MRHPKLITGLALLTSTLVACGSVDTPATGVDDTEAQFSTAPGEPNHEEITAAALDFLRLDVVWTMAVGNVTTDLEFFFVNANHFDDCNFSGGSRVVSDQQAAAVQNLNPADPSVEAEQRAAIAFGRSIHALQDFYAHTNWVELGGDTLVDASLAAFPTLAPYATIPSTGFTIVQGPKPRKAALTRDEAAPYPANAVVTYRTGRAASPGLVSGTVDYEPGDFCPSSVAMTHDELNKDKSTLTDRVAQYEQAKALAVEQTRHEWCRLQALTRAAWGDAGTARLAAWVTPGAAAPDCAAAP